MLSFKKILTHQIAPPVAHLPRVHELTWNLLNFLTNLLFLFYLTIHVHFNEYPCKAMTFLSDQLETSLKKLYFVNNLSFQE